MSNFLMNVGDDVFNIKYQLNDAINATNVDYLVDLNWVNGKYTYTIIKPTEPKGLTMYMSVFIDRVLEQTLVKQPTRIGFIVN